MKKRLWFIISGLLLINASILLPASAQTADDNDKRTRILFLLDASGSMQSKWGPGGTETRMFSAKRILKEMIDFLDKREDVELGLRVYGHQYMLTEKNCRDTQLEVGFSRSSGSYIKSKLELLNPKGVTPIAYSLEKAASDFPDNKARNIIILMTDGEESCGGDPCLVARTLEEKKIVLKHFVIGIGVEESARQAFDCIGSYSQVQDPTSLKQTLNNIVNRILIKTTSQVDLLDSEKNPSETDVNMTFYSHPNRLRKYDFYHTLNARGNPDTLYIDPVTDYDLVVHTLPPVEKEGITLLTQKHNHIRVDAPQGNLEVYLKGKTINNNLNNKIKCLVRNNDGKLVNVQDFNTSEKYLVGKYDLEILTLPPTYLKDVDISQFKTTTVELPTPGIVNLVKKYDVYGGIFLVKEGMQEKIYELNADAKSELLALSPGSYRLIFRPKHSRTMHKSKTIEFQINSGESLSLNL
ncbi:MAG TPA: VWA domain-containing protein [Chitinophagales bacterium]|nr:VWA domain-containing protein [Chitinophagales bacterium]